MVSSPGNTGHVEEKFSLPLFFVTVVVSFAALAGLVKLIAPESVWAIQISASFLQFAVAFLAIHLVACFVEYAFHRYVLHKPVVPFLSRFYRQHTLHHNLTRIGRRRTASGREVPFVENIYPITEDEQGEASFFPWYTLAVFAVVLTPLLAVLQWLAPSFPWFFGGYSALAFSLFLYETFHAIEHWPFEKWAPLIESRRMGWFWRKVYSFHLRHHAVIDCNEAISGFFTLPVFDWVFGTFILPKSLYANGEEWKPSEFKSPEPCALIRWCDTQSDALIKRRRARVAAQPSAQAAPVLTYTRGETIAHYFTHGIGLAGSAAGFILLVSFAAMYGDVQHLVSCLVFGITLVICYAAFMNFSRARRIPGKKRFTDLNHAAALLLIAGTATPFLLGSVRGPWGWSLFAATWGVCLLAVLVRLCCTGKIRVVGRAAYAVLGLLALVAIKPVLAAVPPTALWLVAGGIACYAVGTVFHMWYRMHYHQIARHALALGGTACHLLAVLLFVLPLKG